MAKDTPAKDWFDIADTELASAEYLTNMRHPSPDAVICYLCQQAAEKYLKGFFVSHNMEPPKIHNLLDLLNICEPIHTHFSSLSAKCAFLNTYSVIPRYPNELRIPTPIPKSRFNMRKKSKILYRPGRTHKNRLELIRSAPGGSTLVPA
jgi:HEPN domain-containing protein